MPFKDYQKQLEYGKEYHKRYYSKHRKERLDYRKKRREKDREVYKKWIANKKDEERKKKINLGQIYRPKNPYS